MIRILILFLLISLNQYLNGFKSCDESKPQKQVYSINFMTGKTSESDTLFRLLPAGCVQYGNQYMHKEAAEAFTAMYNDALSEGIRLTVISAYRSYDVQKWLWEGAWQKHRHLYSDDVALATHILKYLSMPGTSRHHWGTEVDICSTALAWWESPQGKRVYEWLSNNASRYGFYQPYGPLGESRKSGYQQEKWHWSYGRVATDILNQYVDSVSYANFSGFKGSKTAKSLAVIENYVLSVEKYSITTQ
ncbi:MAG TPA: M15 family metallopeptidase [Bacteroidales bacterium]|nr:M15 family metallopeptidase [Bacteroidales bacterium]